MNIFRINTTAFEEEDFYLMTSLTEKKIKKVIKPIVEKERQGNGDGDSMYNNEELVNALKEKYPNETVVMYQELDVIEI